MPPTTVSTRHDIGEHPYRAGPAWHRLFAYNNLPPVPNEQLTTLAVERRYELAAAALDALRDATSRIADFYCCRSRKMRSMTSWSYSADLSDR